ncbi:MAG: transposase [Phycisphaerales bacterium]|nr:transposase [Phycisphaerales bacterium]
MLLHRKAMRRFEHESEIRFLTFSTSQRLQLFSNDAIKDRFLEHLVHSRRKHLFHLYGYVVMPEHVHLLVWPLLPDFPLSTVLRDLKRDFAEEVIGRWTALQAPVLNRLRRIDGSHRFWQRGGGYDHNVRGEAEFFEKLRYIHENPVDRGLVPEATQYHWSSARWYRGDRSGPLAMDPVPPTRPCTPPPSA